MGIQVCESKQHEHHLINRRARIESENHVPDITIIHAGEKRIFEDVSSSVSSNIHAKLKEHGIKVKRGKAIGVQEKLLLSDGKELPYDYLVWATGAKPSGVLSDLGVDLCMRIMLV
mgnify:CR=1 FL=1